MSEPDFSTFGKRLVFLMEERPIKGLPLSKEIGLDDGAISKHRVAPRAPSIESVDKYVTFFKVNYDWLAYGRGPMRGRPNTITETRVGSGALEEVLRHFVWPEDLPIEIGDRIVDLVRREAFADGKDRPESMWHLRLKQLIRELTKPPGGPAPRLQGPSTDEESPEIQEHRRVKKRR